MQKRTHKFRWLLLALLIGGLAFYVWPQPHTAATANAVQDVMTVSITHPQQSSVAETLHASGIVSAREEVVITSELSAVRVTQVYVDEGSWVKKRPAAGAARCGKSQEPAGAA